MEYIGFRILATAFFMFLAGVLLGCISESEGVDNAYMERFAFFLLWVAGFTAFGAVMYFVWS